MDHALDFLAEARDAKKPWLLYIAPNAPHSPVQPLREDYEKYAGRYDKGWDESHAQRVKNQQELGIIAADTRPAPRPAHIPAWQDLESVTRNWEARRRAAYAALVHRLDIEIGRVLADIEKHDEWDNTLIIFLSDNGASPYDRRNIGAEREPYEPGAAWSNSTGWAWVSNTPFRLYKQNQFEGGIASPTIVHWPRGVSMPPGSIVTTHLHISDILPTIAAAAGVTIPDKFAGRDLRTTTGISMLPLFEGRDSVPRQALHFQYVNDRALISPDGWKIVSFRGQPWELYHLAKDRTELDNLAGQHPERVQQMADAWPKQNSSSASAGGSRPKKPPARRPIPNGRTIPPALAPKPAAPAGARAASRIAKVTRIDGGHPAARRYRTEPEAAESIVQGLPLPQGFYPCRFRRRGSLITTL
jgi:arylsulfatase A-like enzyme